MYVTRALKTRWRSIYAPTLLTLCLIATAVSCRSDEGRRRKLRDGPVGTLIGEVQLAPGATLPRYAALDMLRRPLHVRKLPAPPTECEQANELARTPVTVTSDGLLRGVVVAASDFVRVREREPRQHKVAIEHCHLQPSVITAQGGDVLLIENRDDYNFEPLVGPAYEGKPLPRDERLKVYLNGGSIDTVQCSLGAPCGRTDLLVFFHPAHTVTDDKGHFRIDNFPAAELVRVTAWHPLFEPSEGFVWVEPGKEHRVKLQLTPKARFVSPHP